MPEIPVIQKNIPSVTVRQMIEVDRLMVEYYGIDLVRMMENAGLNLALLARRKFLSGNIDNKQVVVLAGKGGNGGGNLVAARRLANWGARVSVVLGSPADHFSEVAGQQLKILRTMGISIDKVINAHADLILDGLIGYRLKGSPRGFIKYLIEEANDIAIPVISLDVPSGLDLNSGEPKSPTMKANATLTLALPKTGLLSGAASAFTGDLFLADIGVPPMLYQHLGLDILNIKHLFSQSTLVQLGDDFPA